MKRPSFDAITRSMKQLGRPLVFDLDGTLIDSRSAIAGACNYALLSTGRVQLPPERIHAHVGSGARALIAGVLGEEIVEEEITRLLQAFQAHYLEHPISGNLFLPGALPALSLRAERKVALCTNKPMHLTRAVLKALELSDAFDSVVAPALGDQVKPHPELLLRVASELGVAPDTLVMIGDSPQDVGAGKAVGAHTIGVRGGFLPFELLLAAEPDVILQDLTELPAYLESLDR